MRLPKAVLAFLSLSACVQTIHPTEQSCQFTSDCDHNEVCSEGICVPRKDCSGSNCSTGPLTAPKGDAGSQGVPGQPHHRDGSTGTRQDSGPSGGVDASPVEAGMLDAGNDAGVADTGAPGMDASGPADAAPAPMDASMPILARGVTCTKDQDCETNLCRDFGSPGGRRCTESCGKSSDCTSGFTCIFLNGATLCAAPPVVTGSFNGAIGSSCSVDSDCHSNVCIQNTCVESCTVELDCPSGQSCGWGQYQQNLYFEACIGPIGGTTAGRTCNAPGDCASGVCYDDNGTGRCASLCSNSLECQSNEVCSPVDFSFCTNGAMTCPNPLIQTVKGCLRANPGNGLVGAPCTSDSDCRSTFCNTTLGQCIDTCSTNRDCPPSHRCKVDAAFSLAYGVSVDVNLCLPLAR